MADNLFVYVQINITFVVVISSSNNTFIIIVIIDKILYDTH